MKKTYINPTLDVIEIKTMQMLAASENVEFGEDKKPGGSADAPDDFDFDFDDYE